MVNPGEKPLTLYPISVIPRDQIINGEDLADWFQVQNVIRNSKNFKHRGHENLYSVIVDKCDSDQVFGRFVKLKKDNVEKLIRGGTSEEKYEEKLEVTKENEFIEANSYFVWNTIDNLMLAEYNTESVNILTGTSSSVLNHGLGVHQVFRDFRLAPFPSSEFIQQIIDDGGVVSRYYLSFEDLSKSYLESLKMDANLIWQIAEKNTLGLSMAIKLDTPKTLTEQLFGILRDVSNKIDDKAKKFVVHTSEGNFDLIGVKFIYYSETARIEEDIIKYRNEIYREISEVLADKKQSLQGIRKKKKSSRQVDLDPFF